MEIAFDEVYREYASDIKITAFSQRVPGLDYDDVVAEMNACLWKAWRTYRSDNGTKFGSYWWSIWQNRKRDLRASQDAQRAPKYVYGRSDDIGRIKSWADKHMSYTPKGFPDPPEGCTKQEQMVWCLVACGEPRSVILAQTGITRRRYYAILRNWRKDDVLAVLTPG